MVRFLLEHSLPLDERTVMDDDANDWLKDSSTTARPSQGFVEREQVVSDAMAALWE